MLAKPQSSTKSSRFIQDNVLEYCFHRSMPKVSNPPYTPALGSHKRTGDYDRIIAVMTRERRWRTRMLNELSLDRDNTIVDIGSGTGSFAKLMVQACPGIRVVALDPDPEVRRIAENKTIGLGIEYVTAMGSDPIESAPNSTVDTVTCSLVLHQCSMSAKIGILENAQRLLKTGGSLLISDYGEQRTMLMSLLFNQVRQIDGYENTQANKDGMIPILMKQAGFHGVAELAITPTPTGSISLYRGHKPAG